MQRTVWSRGGCVSYYQTASGRNTTLWPGFTFALRTQLRKRASADYTLAGQDVPEAPRSLTLAQPSAMSTATE